MLRKNTVTSALYRLGAFLRTTVHVAVRSCYCRAFYVDVVQHWRGAALPYILVVLTCSVMLNVGYMMYVVYSIKVPMADRGALDSLTDTSDPLYKGHSRQPVDRAASRSVWLQALERLPIVTIEKGTLSIAEPQPFYIRATDFSTNKHAEAEAPLILIDTIHSTLPRDAAKATILVTAHGVRVRPPFAGEMHYRFVEDPRSSKKVIVDHAFLNSFLDTVRPSIMRSIIVTMPIVWLAVMGVVLARAACMACIGLVFSSFLQIPLSFLAWFRLAIIASIPLILFEKLLLLMPGAMHFFYVLMPHPQIFPTVITAGYFLFGIYANRSLRP